MVQYIEIVCSGNQGRSPFGELRLQNRLDDLGVSSHYNACSSGVIVDKVLGYERGEPLPDNYVKFFVEKGLGKGLYEKPFAQDIERLLAKPELSAEEISILQQPANIALMRFQAEELEHRAEAIRRLGLRGKLKDVKEREQTAPKEGVVLFLGYEDKHIKLAKEIYVAHGINPENQNFPEMSTVANYVGEDVRFTDAFGGTLDDYLDMARTIVRCMDKVAMRFLSERGIRV